MIADLKRLLNHVSIYGVAVILERAISFLLLPLYTNIFPPDQYSIVINVFIAIGFLTVVYLSGLDMAFTRFFFLRESKFSRSDILSTTLISFLSSSLLISTLILIFASKIVSFFAIEPIYGEFVRWSVGIIFFDALALFGYIILRAEERSKLFSILKITVVTVTLSLNILFVAVLKLGIEYIFIANFIASFLKFVFVLPVLAKYFRIKFSKEIYRNILKFGLPYIIPGLAVISMDTIDRLFITSMLGDHYNGIYGAAYKLAMALNLYVAAFRFAWHPFFLSIAENENAKDIYAKVLTYFITVGGFLYIAVTFFVKDLATFTLFGKSLIEKQYWEGFGIVPIVMPAYILYGVYVNFVVGVYIKKKTNILSVVVGIPAIVNILLNYYMIPIYGIYGAAYATLIAYGLMAILLFAASRRFYPVTYEFKRLLTVVVVSGLICVPFFLGYLENAIIRLGVLASYPAILLLSGFLNDKEKSVLLRIINIKGRK